MSLATEVHYHTGYLTSSDYSSGKKVAFCVGLREHAVAALIRNHGYPAGLNADNFEARVAEKHGIDPDDLVRTKREGGSVIDLIRADDRGGRGVEYGPDAISGRNPRGRIGGTAHRRLGPGGDDPDRGGRQS